MSTAPNSDPRVDHAAVTDATLLASHEKMLGAQPDEKARYRLMPLALLFIFSGLVFFGGTYVGRYAALFDPTVYNENVDPSKAGAAPIAAADPVEVGRRVYAQVCASCHQANGMGLPGAFPPLAGAEWVTGSEDALIRIAVYGMQGPVTVKGVEYNSFMPATGRVAGSGFNLPDDRIAAVLTYIRQEWGNDAPPISTQKVTEVRTREGDRAPWTAAELQQLP
jgi:mono/diheme cytochrome c family protein